MRKTTYAYYFEIDGKKAMIKLGDYLRGKREVCCEDKIYRSIPLFISKKINEDLVARKTLATPFRYHVLKQDKGVMSSEIQFQEVVSNSATEGEPLGTLAGRGINVGQKGGEITVKVTEPCYLIGIFRLVL